MTSITVRVSRTGEGFVGQCVESPQFIVSTRKKSDIPKKITTAIQGYVYVFPEERENVLPGGNDDFTVKLV